MSEEIIMKYVTIFLIAVLGFGVVVGLLHNRMPDPLTWGLGFFVMLLIGYPIQREKIERRLTFPQWIVKSTIGGLLSIAVGFLIQRVF
jgi:hypothetical protein